jgi:hypothetical protein
MISTILICFFCLVLLWVLCVCIRAHFVAYSETLAEQMRQGDTHEEPQQMGHVTVEEARQQSESDYPIHHPHHTRSAVTESTLMGYNLSSNLTPQQLRERRTQRIAKSLRTLLVQQLPVMVQSNAVMTSNNTMVGMSGKNSQSSTKPAPSSSSSPSESRAHLAIETNRNPVPPIMDSNEDSYMHHRGFRLMLQTFFPQSIPSVDPNSPCQSGTKTKAVVSSSIQLDEEEASNNTLAPLRDSNIECPICLDPYQVGDIVSWSIMTDTCSHAYHRECIMSWLMENDDCPMCRQVLLIDEADMSVVKSKSVAP